MANRICSGFLLLIFFLLQVLSCSRAEADTVTGTIEFDYDTLQASSASGNNSVRTQVRDFTQQYTLNVNLHPFEPITVSGGMYVTKDVSKSSGTSDTVTTVQPYLDVRYQDPFGAYTAGASYRELKTSTKVTNGLSETLVNDQYNAFLGWTPFELPLFNVQTTRNNSYDVSHTLLDNTTDTILFSTQYKPRREWDLSATLSHIDSTDRLSGLGSTTQSEDVRVNYQDSFWGRLTFTGGYILDLLTTTVTQQGTGAVPFQLFPLVGLSSTTDFPAPTDILTTNQLLIDGNILASAGVNIGTSVSLPPDNKFREMGVDFGTVTEVNNVEIWINEALTTVIANSFAWNVYTSPDGINWTLLQTVQPAVFGPFENRFSISFQNVKTRYLKVATRPLSQLVQGAIDPIYQNIFVTEMKTFIVKSAAEIRGKNSLTGQQLNLSDNLQLFEGVSQYSVINWTESANNSGGTELKSHHYFISNGINLTRPFTIVPTVTANARVSRDDNVDSNGNHLGSYNFGAGLTAVPLPTLRGSLQYNGSLYDNHTKSDNVTLSSTAEIYPGVNAGIVGGLNSGFSPQANATTNGSSFRANVSLVPYRTLTLSFDYATSRQSTHSVVFVIISEVEQWDAGIAYRPFDSLYLTAGITGFHGTDRPPSTLQNYGLNWSPFSGGTVQFNFGYTENFDSSTNLRTKTVGPTVTWAVAPRASITLSYLVATTSSLQTETETRSLFGQFKMNF